MYYLSRTSYRGGVYTSAIGVFACQMHLLNAHNFLSAGVGCALLLKQLFFFFQM